MIALLALACTGPEAEPAGGVDPAFVLTRASLDLRGRRPDAAELAAVTQTPGTLETRLDTFLLDPAFGERVQDVFDEATLTRSELYLQDPDLFGISDDDAFYAAVGGEIPQIIGRIAEQDLPWTEAVTGDWTMANEVLAELWALDYPEGASGWRVAHYTDGRPAAGILSTNSFYWRYDSTLSNANRKRANAIARLFVCNDFIGQPILFDDSVDVSDPDSFAEAVRTVPGCVGCHAALDPVAAHLFGFFYHFQQNPGDANAYHPEREVYWTTFLGVGPGFFGQESGDVSDLGWHLAADPRFPDCAVEHVWRGLLRRDPTLADTDALSAHREAFLTGDLTLRALWRSILDDPRYRADDVVGTVAVKLVTPRLLASQVEALTGYRLTLEGVDAMMSDRSGVRTLAGGLDGFEGTLRTRSPNPTLVLVQQRLAEAAAAHAVAQDPMGLLRGVDLDSPPEADDLEALHIAVLSQTPTEAELDALADLWDALYGLDDDPRAAWAGVLTALMRDPAFLLY
ncbi:MAG: hypothetical protein H6739_34760 [Alphaproteobacteria bacterium]|nr:hypothetical protein [Alphaproteobacteria bacterium]